MRPAMPGQLSANSLRFSVVIPTYRRPGPLARCLDALAIQRFPADELEIIVVDDAGDSAVADHVRGRSQPRCSYLSAKRRTGPAGARNAGAEASSGEYLAFLDDDCIPDPGWLAALDAAIHRRRDAIPVLFGGRNLDHGEGAFVRASQCLLDYLLANANRDPDAATFFPSNNIALLRTAFFEIDGFDPRFPQAAAEDRDFCERWLARGYRMVSVPCAIVAHEHRSDLGGFVRQHAGYGRGLAILNRRRSERRSTTPRLQPARFYAGLLGAGLSQASLRERLQTTALLALSQVATAAGFVHERWRSRRTPMVAGA